MKQSPIDNFFGVVGVLFLAAIVFGLIFGIFG